MQKFLTLAERQYVVKYELDSMRAMEDQRIPGIPTPKGKLKARVGICEYMYVHVYFLPSWRMTKCWLGHLCIKYDKKCKDNQVYFQLAVFRLAYYHNNLCSLPYTV